MKKIISIIFLLSLSLFSLNAQNNSKNDFYLVLVDEQGNELAKKLSYDENYNYGEDYNGEPFLRSDYTVKILVKSKKQKVKLDIQDMEIRVFRGGKAIESKVQKNNVIIDLASLKTQTGDGILIKVLNVKKTSLRGKVELVNIPKPFISFFIR